METHEQLNFQGARSHQRVFIIIKSEMDTSSIGMYPAWKNYLPSPNQKTHFIAVTLVKMEIILQRQEKMLISGYTIRVVLDQFRYQKYNH